MCGRRFVYTDEGRCSSMLILEERLGKVLWKSVFEEGHLGRPSDKGGSISEARGTEDAEYSTRRSRSS